MRAYVFSSNQSEFPVNECVNWVWLKKTVLYAFLLKLLALRAFPIIRLPSYFVWFNFPPQFPPISPDFPDHFHLFFNCLRLLGTDCFPVAVFKEQFLLFHQMNVPSSSFQVVACCSIILPSVTFILIYIPIVLVSLALSFVLYGAFLQIFSFDTQFSSHLAYNIMTLLGIIDILQLSVHFYSGIVVFFRLEIPFFFNKVLIFSLKATIRELFGKGNCA